MATMTTTPASVHFDKITGPDHSDDASQRNKRSNVPSLVCAFSASVTTGGTIYAFGIYGDALKKSLNLSQLQLDSISATFFIAGLFSWIPGLVVDRMGMRFSMCLGGSGGATFVLMYWAISRQFVPVPHVVSVLSVLAVAICLSCGLIIGSIFKLTLLYGGPGTRGSAVGIAKGFVGLGAGVYATIFEALRTEDESALDFLPVIAFFFILCAALPAFLLLPTKAQTAPHLILIETTPFHFRTMFVSLFVLAIVIVTSAITDILDQDDPSVLSHVTRDYKKVSLIVFLWLGPIISLLYLPRLKDDVDAFSERLHLPESRSFDALGSLTVTEDEENRRNEEQKALVSSSSYQKETPPQEKVLPDEHDRADLNLSQMLRTPSAWLMLWTTTILVGSGTYKTNNMGEMVEALGFADALTPATLAIFSVAQAGARIVTGVVSEAALKWNVRSCCVNYGVPRPFFLLIASSIAVLGHAVLVVSTSEIAFVVGCTISGISFGMAWPLMVLIVGDIFGLEHHGANYMFYDGFTKAVGTIFLSEFVAGNVYEAHVDTTEGDGLTCFGPSCFRMTHLAVTGLALTCVLSSLALQYASRRAYNKPHRA